MPQHLTSLSPDGLGFVHPSTPVLDRRSIVSHARPLGRARLVGALGLLAILVLSLTSRGADSAATLPAVDDKWRYFSSPNFELYSRNDESSSRELLHNLELLRAVFLEQLKLEPRLHVPVTVYSFRSRKDFVAYAPAAMKSSSGLAGFYLFRPDRAVISMAPAEESDEAKQTIFHEYIHHLFRTAEFDPPLWFNEGTAEVFAGITVDRNRVQIGAPVDNRVLYLRQESLLPLEQLFNAEKSEKLYKDDTHTGVFYAESWALLHYWRYGESGFSHENIDRFLKVASDRTAVAKVDLRKYFRECFGCDYAEMEKRLQSYVRRGTYRMGTCPMPKIADQNSYAVRAVPREEINLRLAELAVRVERSPLGKLVLLNAVTSSPADVRPLETLGTDALIDHDERSAADSWEKALAAGSQNPAVIRELALMEGRQWFTEFDESFRLPRETADRIRARLLRSIKEEPAQGAAYEMLAWIEAFTDGPVVENINQVITHLPTMRDKRSTLVAMAALMLRLHRGKEAAVMLSHLDGLQLELRDARAKSVLLQQLRAEFPGLVSGGGTINDQSIAAPPNSPGNKTPSVSLPDDL
jgi:hypothetical protein